MRTVVVLLLLLLMGPAALGADGPENDPLAPGRSLLRTPRHEEGVKLLREVIVDYREDPEDAVKQVWVGRAHFLLEEDVEAVKALERATQLAPKRAWVHLWLGIVLKWVDLPKAEAPLRESIRLDPDYWCPRLHLGVVLKRQGRLDEALASLEASLELHEENPGAHFNAGVILGKKGREEEALAHFERAAALDPTHESSRYNLGLAAYEKKAYEQALAWWTQCVALDANDLLVHAQILKVLNALERHEEAAKRRETILALHAASEDPEVKKRESFPVDKFLVEGARVRVREFFDKSQERLYVVIFSVVTDEGREFRVNLEPSASYAWLGGAKYVLGMNEGSSHSTFRKAWKTWPAYPELKEAAIRAIRGELGVASSSDGETREVKIH